jgi:hypothetical protein
MSPWGIGQSALLRLETHRKSPLRRVILPGTGIASLPVVGAADEEEPVMAKLLVALVFAASFLVTSVPTAVHAQRFVVVNGRVMNQQALDSLDRAACQQVPNGYYWLDLSTGVWGYAGNPAPQGHISDGCRQARRPSLSERGMLYSPYDWVR